MEKRLKYYIYDKDSTNYDKWYTTNEHLIKGFKFARLFENIGKILSAIGLSSLFLALGLGVALGWIVGVIFGAISIISLICIWPFYSKFDKLFDYYLDLYFKTSEYKKLKRKYDKQIKEERDKRLREKSKKLVEAYDIIDNKNLTQEERIELLKNYVDWRN